MSELTKNVKPLDDFNWDEFENSTEIVSKEELDKAYEATLRKVTPHQKVDGTIVTIDKDEVVVNIGYKSEGTIPISEFAYNPDLRIGDKVKVYIVESGEKLVLSHNIAIGVEPEPNYNNIDEEANGNESFILNQDAISEGDNVKKEDLDKKKNYNTNRIDIVYDTSNIDEKQLNDESLTKRDEQGSIYSIDGKKLYKASSNVSELRLAEGLEIICDEAVSFHWSRYVSTKEVYLPKSLKAIGDLAFFNNKSIKKIYCPDSVCYISHANPFAGCIELEDIVTHDNSNNINYHYVIHEGFLFDCINRVLIAELPFKHKGLLDINDKNKISFENWKDLRIQKIGSYAFYGTSFETVILSGNISYSCDIPESCFSNSKVKNVEIPSWCREIAKEAFYQSQLEKINIDSVSRIGERAFCECNIRQISFAKNIYYIGEQAFKDCPLYFVNFEGTPNYIGEEAFSSKNLDTIRYVNKELLSFDFIKRNQDLQKTQLVSAEEATPMVSETRFLSSSVSISIPTSHNAQYFYSTRGISPYEAQVVRLRIPSKNNFLWGVKSEGNYIVLPRYDNVSAVIALDNIYSLTELHYADNTLYQLFLKSDQIFSISTNDKIQLNNHIVRFKHIYKTSNHRYEEKDLQSEFIDSRDYNEFDNSRDTLPTKFISLRKDGKIALIVSGMFISDFEYDSIKAIDNVFLKEEWMRNGKKVIVPFLSMTCVLVSKIIDGIERFGISNEFGDIVVPICYKKIMVCMNYILADNQLYKLEKSGIQLICTDINLSVPIFVYKGIIAVFKSKDSYFAYRKGVLSKVDGDKYVFYSSKDYVEYYNVKNGNLCIEDDTPFEEYESDYSQDELNDMYRDAFDGNPEYESNID